MPGLGQRAGLEESAIRTLKETIERAKLIEAHNAALNGAADEARQAHATWGEEQTKLAKLRQRANEVRARSAELRAKNEQAIAGARQPENEAAKAYASAVSGGDAPEEKAALAKLQKAQAAMASALADSKRLDTVLVALEAEAVNLDRQADVAKAVCADLRARVTSALRLCLQARWDEQLSVLFDIGAQLAAIETDTRGWLSKVKVPIFEHGLNHLRLGRDEILLRTEGITVDDLVSAVGGPVALAQ